jgi:hypothetical protein
VDALRVTSGSILESTQLRPGAEASEPLPIFLTQRKKHQRQEVRDRKRSWPCLEHRPDVSAEQIPGSEVTKATKARRVPNE